MRQPLIATSLLLGLTFAFSVGLSAKSDGVSTLVSSKGEVTFRRTTDPEGRWSAAYPELRNKLLDHVKTGADSVATLEFDIGGRVGVNTNSEIEIVSQRKVEAVDGGAVETLIVTAGSIWAKINKGQSTQLQVQTSGGVMGIKGTEFTVEVDEQGESRLTVLEGEVVLTPESGEQLVVLPGDQIAFLRSGIRERLQRPLQDLRSQLQGRFRGLPTEWMNLNVPLPRFQNLDIAVELEPLARAQEAMDRAAEATDRAADATDRAMEATARVQAGLGRLDRLQGLSRTAPRERPNLDFPQDLQPYQASLGPQRPTFQWTAFPGATHYAVLVARDAKLTDLVWSARPAQPSAAYPANGAALQAGRYHWRVIPLGENNRPVGRASQSWFDSSGWNPDAAR